LKLAEEQSKRESRSQQQNNNGPTPVDMQRTDIVVQGAKEKKPINNAQSNGKVTVAPIQILKQSEPPKMSFRDSLIRSPTKTAS